MITPDSDHYVGVVRLGEIVIVTPACHGWALIEDPESPPPGMGLVDAVEAASRAKYKKGTLIMSRQSDGSYFPVAAVKRKKVTLLFDPGTPRLTLTGPGKSKLKRMGVTI